MCTIRVKKKRSTCKLQLYAHCELSCCELSCVADAFPVVELCWPPFKEPPVCCPSMLWATFEFGNLLRLVVPELAAEDDTVDESVDFEVL